MPDTPAAAPAPLQASAPAPSHTPDLAGPPVLPSHFLREAIAGFLERLRQHRAAVAELEAALVGSGAAGGPSLRATGGSGSCGLSTTRAAGPASLGSNAVNGGARAQRELAIKSCFEGVQYQPAVGRIWAYRAGHAIHNRQVGPLPGCPRLAPAGYAPRRGSQAVDGLQALQGALTNVHDCLIHTAARLQVRGAPCP